jgi:hypothetical protein
VAHLSRHVQLLQVTGLIRVERRGSWHDIQISSHHPAADTICAAVLSMPDSEGVFADDLLRLVNLIAPVPSAEAHSAESSFGLGADSEEGITR